MAVEQHELVVVGQHREVPLDLGLLAAVLGLGEVAPGEELAEPLPPLLEPSTQLAVIPRQGQALPQLITGLLDDVGWQDRLGDALAE